MTPAETAAWDAEIDAREGRVRFIHPCYIEPVFTFKAPKSHALIYSRLRERNAFDPAYRPRHMSHRAEVAA